MDLNQKFLPDTLCLAATCLLASLVGASLAYLGSDAPPASQADRPQSLSADRSLGGDAGGDAPRYIMKNHGGKLAVYRTREDSPMRVYDVYVSTLPPYDQQLLLEGIPVQGEEALAQMIEDYVS